ncbi:MAG: hypothetical protein HY952_00710 [Elusimicrobia bacterium]|nr:hypothetical protein [Elusimicrobiota bacterium]
MKHFLFSLLLLGGALPACAGGPKTYGEAQNDLGWLSHDAAAYRKVMTKAIKEQASNLEVMNRLTKTKIKVEEMIQRDNAVKACKAVEYGLTAATLGAGGIALATEAGVSVLAKEGMKRAGKYIGKGVLTEAGKEAAGVPGYSDAVKAGTFVFNKVDENELSGQLSKDNIDVLLKAKNLLEDESDGRTLREKLPELRQMVFDMQDKLDKTAVEIKAADQNIQNVLGQAAPLLALAAKLKEEEKKSGEKAADLAKKTQPAGLVNTEISKPAAVPPPAAGPKDTPQEARLKMQAAIDKYVAGLRSGINAEQKAAEAAWASVTKPETSGTRYFVADEIEDLFASLTNLEDSLGGTRTYGNMQSVEQSADAMARRIGKLRAQLESQRSDIRSRIEPIMTNLSGYAAQWRSVYNTYKPQGYYVSEPDNVKGMTAWTTYYENPLKYAEGYLKATDGLEARFRGVQNNAAGQKDAIYTEASELMASYLAKAQAFKDYKPQVTGQLEKITAAAAKKNEVLNALPNDFVNEFAYDGKYDLKDLEAKVAAARPAFSELSKLYAGGTVLAQDLAARAAELSRLASSPLRDEAGYIAYSAENKAHKAAMAAILKRSEEYSSYSLSADGWYDGSETAANLMFGAEEALKYLKGQSDKLAAAYGKAATGVKANAARDLTYLETLDAVKYGEEMQKLFEPSQRAEEEKNAIIGEVKKAALFGSPGLLERTGFWTVQAGAKRDELEKATAAFWGSAKGKALSEARRVKELGDAQNKRDPGLAIVKKMYEDFAKAYESRNAARVMSFISDSWSAGDGTAASDLDEQFRNIFRVYDEITVAITGLNIVNDGPGRYTAAYDMDIRSRIYKKNIKREEKSSVYEHVAVEGGAARITKTESGGYWDIK